MSNKEVGIINKNEDGRFIIFVGEFNHILLTSGSVIEVFDEATNSWVKTRIEFNGTTNQYYGTNIEIRIGQKARLA